MADFGEKLDRAAGQATCAALASAGASLIGYGAVGLAAGGTGTIPIAAGSLALLASNLACTWDPNQGEPYPPEPPDLCYEGASIFRIYTYKNGVLDQTGTDMQRITSQKMIPTRIPMEDSKYILEIKFIDPDGESGVFNTFTGTDSDGNTFTQQQVWTGDDTCIEPAPPPPPIDIPPYIYTDPDDGCQLTVNLKGFQQDPTGAINPVFKIEPTPAPNGALRAENDVIGGCNFSPVIYTGGPPGGGQPPQYRPWQPSWDDPAGGPTPWEDLVNDLAGELISNLLYDALRSLFEKPYPPATYKLIAPCDTDAAGNPLEIEVEIPELPNVAAIATRVEALLPILQGQKNFKQPVCPPVPLVGDFRTISFKSDTVSPNGKSRLLKRLKYRSVSGIGLDALIDHWKDFVFEAGPVTVKHRGASWGTITVWANSSDEGKRVIRHAAAEAGIDPDQVGYWEIGGSSSTRLGMPGTMRINTSGGYYWITERDGPTERPQVGQT